MSPARHWLLKSEPDSFSFADLLAAPQQTTRWDGVRNYQARNLLRDEVRRGDGVLFYHSRQAPMAVVGLAQVVREAYPDPTQFDSGAPGFDAASPAAQPRWVAVDIRAVAALPRPVTLAAMRGMAALATMPLLRPGQRLSVQPVTAAQWRAICAAGGRR